MTTRKPIRRARGADAVGDSLLRDRFVSLWRRCLLPGALSDTNAVWGTVRGYYTQPHRKYHNEQHLALCLDQLDLVTHEVEQSDQIEMGIWFHDVVYDLGQPDNEARSAALFREFSGQVMHSDFVNAVVELILVTTHNQPPTERTHQVICDIDLASFGYPWQHFLEDSTNLRAEFQGSEDDYYLGKRSFLESLLQRPKIFMTDGFNARYERQARSNIRRFLDLIDQDTH